MIKWLRGWMARYDLWCQSMGLTPEQRRSCVPYKEEPKRENNEESMKRESTNE
ncbi:hypothetical protein [Vibrio genomosp. F6]|uniref:hypothetical protein n=1 Tax=Vibrio genomosp. F6 TaxID=723172 RepID=UPI000302F41B|nr:hypothetical protein [Vibrio genomosp. F6]